MESKPFYLPRETQLELGIGQEPNRQTFDPAMDAGLEYPAWTGGRPVSSEILKKGGYRTSVIRTVYRF